MIQVYKPGTSLERNGDIVLMPTECTVTAKLNDVWVLEMVHPIDQDGRWEYIVEEGILKVPTWQASEQLYRIAQIEKTEHEVHVTAYPIFLDSRNSVFLRQLSVSGTAQSVLNTMLAQGPADPDGLNNEPLFRASSNLSAGRAATFEMRNFMDCLSGTEEPTILGLYGGEIVYDNYTIYVNETIGGDHDVYVRYGKNIEGIEYTVDYSDICTRIYPVAYGGHELPGSSPYVDSSLVNSYDMIYKKLVVFDNIRLAEDVSDSDEAQNYIVCSTDTALYQALRAAASDMFNDGVDRPKVNMKIDMVDLAFTDQYKHFANLETISLGDTVHCVHDKLGISSDARAVGITWDCAKNRIRAIELGDFSYDYLRDMSTKINAIANITNPDGSIMAERVRGFLDATRTSIHTIRTTATQAHVMGVLFEDKVTGSPTYGALGIGTKGLMIAKEWDSNTDDWAWETAITADGVLSPMIVTNTVSGTSAQNWWDLQLGQISFQTISDDVDDRINDAVSGIDTDMTGLEICNAIFNDGMIRGFQTRTNPTTGITEFYLSFNAFIGGQGQLGGTNNGNGELIVLDASNNELCRINNAGISVKNSSGYTIFSTTTNGIVVNDAQGRKIVEFDQDGMHNFDPATGKSVASFSGSTIFMNNTSGNIFEIYESYFNYYRERGLILPPPDSYIDFEAVVGSEKGLSIGTRFDRMAYQAPKHLFQLASNSGSGTEGMTLMSIDQNSIIQYVPVSSGSDSRLKENIEDAGGKCLELLRRIRTRSYDWKQSGRHVSVGLIAQELMEVIPELVIKDSNGMYSIAYQDMVPFLLSGIQELDDRLSRLENIVSSMKEDK